jgi:hypothetical protein
VQFYFVPKGDKASVVATNSKLADAAMVEARRALWRTALTALAQRFSARPALATAALSPIRRRRP